MTESKVILERKFNSMKVADKSNIQYYTIPSPQKISETKINLHSKKDKILCILIVKYKHCNYFLSHKTVNSKSK